MPAFLAPSPHGAHDPLASAPSFSVVIAAYQAAHLIADAVESALGQTHPPEEVIVCDDGSTDDIAGALAPYADRIAVIRKPNGGEASAKNAGAGAARGDFVVFLDADDVFLPTRLEALGELARARPDLDVLTSDALLELDGEVVRRCYDEHLRFETGDQRSGILRRNFVFGLAAARRSALLAVGGFDERIRYTTDWDLWLRMIFGGSSVGCVDAPLARYRLQSGSLSAQRAKLIAGRLETLEKAWQRDDLTATERDVLEQSLAENRRDLGLACAREAVRAGDRRARRLSYDVARDARHPAATRLKAAAAAALPRLARVLDNGEVETTGGVRYRPAR